MLVKAGDDNALWVGQMKKALKTNTIKLPSMNILHEANREIYLPEINEPCAYDDIQVVHDGPICYVHFDFYNGAMDKHQAARLVQSLQLIDEMPDVKVVVLMGGERFFSTGTCFTC
ncbi:uncharacterized protein LOC132754464 [Ruditapes philippinarum]|uniref:uncharacterized protein LOC132754464 n=1 Tax=Ruditapes philippinarum TaxID=129788 RepID=UPI00295AFA83|nr:uncharacterized protein LOC132754464 [Ruditapes philippinarum]